MKRLLPAVIVLLALAAPAQASRSQFTIFEAPRELSSTDAGLQAQTLDEIQGLGARWVRIVLYWNDVAPANNSKRRPDFVESDPNAYDWGKYARAVDAARSRGLKVFVTVSGPVPRWATAKRRGHTYKPNPVRFGHFMTAVARRFGDQVDTWSIWNEPNHPQFLRPQFRRGKPASPRIYRRLLKAGVAGLDAAGQGGDRLLAGETAPRGTPRVVAPVTFAKRLLRRKRMKGVEGYAHHPYTTRSGPFFRPPDRKDVTIGVLSRLTRVLPKRMGLYLTEFGIQSKPDPYVGVSERKQAEYRAIAERIAYRNKRVRAFSQYMMRDDAPRPGSRYARYSGFESGLRHSDGREKKSYNGFRLPLVADRRGSRVTLWGLVRPAGGPTSVTIQYRGRKRGWRQLATDATNARGYWSKRTRFVRGRTYRVLWNEHASPRTRVYRAP